MSDVLTWKLEPMPWGRTRWEFCLECEDGYTFRGDGECPTMRRARKRLRRAIKRAQQRKL